MLPARRALLSVSDKTGIVDLAAGLSELGIELISTGGTYEHLRAADIEVTPITEVTGFPEILDGRVKTLHPHVHGGILADRERASHLAELREHDIEPIDLVAVNLYPFRDTVADPESSFAERVEMIDIGGPCMLRAAAKNFRSVVVVVDPKDYPQVLEALRQGADEVPETLRRSLALKAYRHTESYDAAIADWLQERHENERAEDPEENPFPPRLSARLERQLVLRYGENPHQPGAVYRDLDGDGLLGGFTRHQGKELSWNNLLDADSARRLVSLFEDPTVVIVKHTNPCGVGRGETLTTAYEKALACDPMSAFGSIVAANGTVDRDLVTAMEELFVEVLLAPDYTEEALDALAAKENRRVLSVPLRRPETPELDLRAVDGGFLAQLTDDEAVDRAQWTCPTRRQPSAQELEALGFAWTVVRHVKSNAIVIANRNQTVGIGAGQMSRVDAGALAVRKAKLPVEDTVAASDAFFPFRDGVDALAEAGVTAIVQPGGSKRDEEVIAACDEQEVAMMLTGRRHFKH